MSADVVRSYAAEVASRLGRVLGSDELAGVYLGGSLALGGYEPGRSDVDTAAFVRRPLSTSEKEEVVAVVRHPALPCPARKLELVVSVPERVPGFELNLNSGEGEHHVDLTPARASAFWFAIDASIVRSHGVPLLGPAPEAVVPDLPRAMVEAALRDAIRWQIENVVPADDVVLNACRARRFLEEGVWSSKTAAGEWALARLPESGTVHDALALRRGERRSLTRGSARAFAATMLDARP